MRSGPRSLRAACALLLGTIALSAGAVAPPPVDRVAFAPAAGATLPLDARFLDDDGRSVRLGDFVASRPAIVVPAYYGCANLCGIVLHGVAAALAASGVRAGRDVEVVAVSIEPSDTPLAARAKKRAVLGAVTAKGWHFLTGHIADIERFAAALGYRYAWDAAERQYAHAAGIAIVAADGRITRTLYGVAFPASDLRAALAGARAPPGAAAQASASSAQWLLCFHYDPRTGRYSVAAMNAVRVAGLAAMIALGGYVAFTRLRERRGRP